MTADEQGGTNAGDDARRLDEVAAALRARNIEAVVVEDGQAGAGRLILVVGSQKLVPDLDAAMRRIREVVFPWENDRVRERPGVDTSLDKVLLILGEWRPGRTTVVLVREPVGI